MTAQKKAAAAVLSALGLESNRSPAKKGEKLAPTAFLPDMPPPAWKVPLLTAKAYVSVQSVRAAERAGVLRLNLHPARQKTYVPEKVALLPNLAQLSVYDPDAERLRALIITLAKLEHLRWLQVNGSPAPPFELGALRHLRELGLRSQANAKDSGLARLPDAFADLDALSSLTLWGGSLSELPPSFERLSALRDLRLLDLAFRECPRVLATLPALASLSLRARDLDPVDALAVLAKSKSLRNLYLSSDRIGEVVTLGKLTRIVSLSLAIELTELPADVSELPALRFLTVAFNRLERLPETLASAPALETLSVHGNPKLDTDQVIDVALKSKTLRGLCLPNAGPSGAGEKRLREQGFRRARSMTGDQWFRGELLASWRTLPESQNT